MHSAFLLFSACIEGTALMSLEILSSKMIAPYYGSSLYVWAAVIGITMGGLALGYYLGGVLSYKNVNSVKRMMYLFCISAVLLLLTPALSAGVLEATLDLDLRLGIFISCLVFLLPPVTFFGMISPIIIRMVAIRTGKIGYSSGIVFGASTAAGILFTFLTGFYFISAFGVKMCTMALGILLLVPVITHYIASVFQKKKEHKGL